MIEKFFSDLLKYSLIKIIPGIIGFVSIPIITKLFSPGGYGNYSLVMATVMIFATLFGWLPMSIIRFYPAFERDKKLDLFYSTIIKVGFISIFFITGMCSILLFSRKIYFSQELFPLLSLGIGVFIVNAIYYMLQSLLRTKRELNWYGGAIAWKNIGSLGIALILIFSLGRKLSHLLWGEILSIAIILPLLWKKAMGTMPIFRFKMDYFLTKNWIKYSFPLVVGNLAAWILNLSDRYILQIFRDAQEVGIYSASYDIAEKSIGLLTTLFMLAASPLGMSIWEKEEREKSQEFEHKITRFYLLIGVPAIIGLSVLAKSIITIMTGEEFFLGYKIIPFIGLGVFLLGLQQRFQTGILYYKKTLFITLAVLSAGILNLVLNFLFIPQYGYIAAAITTLASYLFLLFLMIILSRRFFTWKFPFKSLVNSICASAIMGVIVYFSGNGFSSSVLINLIFNIFLGGFIYFFLLFLFREFQQSEKKAMKQALKMYLHKS